MQFNAFIVVLVLTLTAVNSCGWIESCSSAMCLYYEAYVTVTECAAMKGMWMCARSYAHTHTRGDNILSFGNHRLTQTGLVSQSRSLCLEKLISKLFHCQDAWTPHFSLLNETPCNFNSTYPVKKACWNKCHTVTIDIHRTGRDSSFITSLLMF